MVLAEAPRAVAAACRGAHWAGGPVYRTMDVVAVDVGVVVAVSGVHGSGMDEVVAMRRSGRRSAESEGEGERTNEQTPHSPPLEEPSCMTILAELRRVQSLNFDNSAAVERRCGNGPQASAPPSAPSAS